MSQTDTPLDDTQAVSSDSTPPPFPATNTADDPAAEGPEVPVDRGDENRIQDVVQPLDPEVQNDTERQADTGPAEAEVVNLQGTDNTPTEPREPDAYTTEHSQPASTPRPTSAPPTDLGPCEPSAVPSQASSVGSIKLWLDTAANAVDGKMDYKDEVEESQGSDDSDAPVRLHPQSRAALTKKLTEDRAEAKQLQKALRIAEAKVVSLLLKAKPMPDRDSLPEDAVENDVTFTEEEWEQAKNKIELAREGIKDVHVLELDWDKTFEYGQSRRVNQKRLRHIERSVNANGLTIPAHVCGVRRDGMSDAEKTSRHVKLTHTQLDRTTAFSRFVQLWLSWEASSLRTWSDRSTRHWQSSLQRRISHTSIGSCRARSWRLGLG